MSTMYMTPVYLQQGYGFMIEVFMIHCCSKVESKIVLSCWTVTKKSRINILRMKSCIIRIYSNADERAMDLLSVI